MDGMTGVRPYSSKESYYAGVVDNTRKRDYFLPIKCDMRLIKSKYYRNICSDNKMNLYYMSLLIDSINGRNSYKERSNLAYYHLFCNKAGKMFNSYLVYAILKIATSYREQGRSEFPEIIRILNQDYDIMKNILSKRKEIITDLENREEQYKVLYESTFFINESSKCKDIFIVMGKTSQDISLLDFIFCRDKNAGEKKYAINLINHMIRLVKVLYRERKIELKWEEIIPKTIKPTCMTKKIDDDLTSLEESVEEQRKEIYLLIEQYIGHIYCLGKELNLFP